MAPSRTAAVACLAVVTMLLPACATQAEETDAPPPVDVLEPLLSSDFADPDILFHDGIYYAYATNANLKNVQVATSADLVDWQLRSEDAFPALPAWAIPGKTWAPEVSSFEDGTFVLYFTATDFETSLQCIGTATASSPLGPFEAVGDGMLICPEEQGGAIDASVSVGDASPHLLWKNDGNCCGHDTWIYASALSPDGLALEGPPIPLIKQTLAWEGDLVEAPTLVKRPEGYVLFYSANSYGGDEYATGYATAETLDGEWTKRAKPFLTTAGLDRAVRGPGGQDVVEVNGENRSVMVIHGWNKSYFARYPYLLELTWDGLFPSVVLGN